MEAHCWEQAARSVVAAFSSVQPRRADDRDAVLCRLQP